MSGPSVTELIHKIESWHAIAGYTVVVDPNAFGRGTTAHIRLRAMPGEVKRLWQMLVETPQIIEADRVTGEDCFVAKAAVGDIKELEAIVDRFTPFAWTDTTIVRLPSPVVCLVVNGRSLR